MDEITYLFPDLNGASIEVWELIGNFIPHSAELVIIHARWYLI